MKNATCSSFRFVELHQNIEIAGNQILHSSSVGECCSEAIDWSISFIKKKKIIKLNKKGKKLLTIPL